MKYSLSQWRICISKMQISLKFIILFLLFYSCKQRNEIQKFNFDEFSICLPSNWKKIEVNGIDSKMNLIITQNKDSIYFDFGQYSEKFNETNKVFSRVQIHKYDSLKMDTKGLFFSDTPEIDQAQGTFLNEFYMYEIIDNCRAKFRIPKKEGIGITGVSIDSVFKSSNRLTITAKNLDKSEQDILVKSFYSIKFSSK